MPLDSWKFIKYKISIHADTVLWLKIDKSWKGLFLNTLALLTSSIVSVCFESVNKMNLFKIKQAQSEMGMV